MIGKTLGHYKIVASLGKGGMGEVYRARDTRLDRDVALKILPADSGADPERGKRFEREAKLIASLNHPNIVTIHAVEEIDGVHFLAMEVIEGKTLADIVPDGGLPLARIFEIAIPLTDALSCAHGKGITHRDLKPLNVMLDTQGRVKVLDFGLAKLVASQDRSEQETVAHDQQVTAEGRILGTTAYMSPEQAEGKELDHRSDIFSLGILLYELATGERPFRGDTPISTVSAILKETPAPVTQLRPLPRHLGRIIGRCLEKNPEKRFQTARDVCNELEGLQKEIASGEHEEFSASASRPAATRRGPLPWVAVAITVVVLAAIGYMWFPRAPGNEPPLQLSSRPLTTSLGLESSGSWSPDGSFFAYSHSDSGPQNIAVAATTGGDPIQLIESESDDFYPRWSPDNRWVAFVSNRNAESAVYLVPPLGGPLRRLFDIGAPPLADEVSHALGAAPWSSDAATLLVSRMSPEGSMALFSVQLDSGATEQLTHPAAGEIDGMASWSFGGDRIVFSRSSAKGSSLMLMPATGGQPREVFFEEGVEILQPAWAPDDVSLVYSNGWGHGELGLLDLETSRRRQLITGGDALDPVVSRDGRIMYTRGKHQTDLYIQRLDGSEVRRLTSHTHSNFGPRFSPDGNAIAYMSDRTGDSEIWLLDLTTGKERRLTDRPGVDASPDWSRDGKEVAYVVQREGNTELWLADVAGSSARKLTDHAVGSIRFSPDGTGIGFLANGSTGSALFVADRVTGETRELLAGVVDFDWYLDANHVIYTPAAREASGELRVVELATGREAVLLREAHVELNVAPDGSAVSYCTSSSHSNMNLFVLRLTAPTAPDELPRPMGPPERITDGNGLWHVHNGGWSPDGRSLVFTRDTDEGDVFVLDGAFE